MSQIQQQLENLPGYDLVMDYYNSYAEEHFNSLDPYEDEDGNKRRLTPDLTTKREQKAWKKVQSQAWTHDKCFLGSCGVGMDCGLGLAPLVVLIFPVLGPIMMYLVHARLIRLAQESFNLPNKLVARLQSNIVIDLVITFPPVIGSFFGWLHGCSTRNAGLIFGYVEKVAEIRASAQGQEYIGTRGANSQQPQFGDTRGMTYQRQQQGTDRNERRGKSSRNAPNSIVVGQQQQSGFL
ncbi:putative membrane protein [Spathaspora sp. JA1]|nr:putative membrane protein [Spathaspora sp. JA1]